MEYFIFFELILLFYQNFSHFFSIYSEFLAQILINNGNLNHINKNTLNKYLISSKNIENLLCTTRESLIGSGAWNREFVSVLQLKPYYYYSILNSCAINEKCNACNKTSKKFSADNKVS